jgi:hypothetical protein
MKIERAKQILKNIVEIRNTVGFEENDPAGKAKHEALKVVLDEVERLQKERDTFHE